MQIEITAESPGTSLDHATAACTKARELEAQAASAFVSMKAGVKS